MMEFMRKKACLAFLLLMIIAGLSSNPVMYGADIGYSGQGLLAYWKLDKVSGKVIDSSGNGNHAINHGATRGVPGVRGKAFSFDGHGDNVELPLLAKGRTLDSFTIALWINLDTVNRDNQDVINFGTKNGLFHISVYNDDVHGAVLLQDEPWVVCEAEDVLEVNKWYHLALTWDGDYVSLYINGELKVRKPAEGKLAVRPYSNRISRRTNARKCYVDGKIDEVRVWDYPLSSSEIQETMEPEVREKGRDVALLSKGATASASSWGQYKGHKAKPYRAIDGSHLDGWGGTQGKGDWLEIKLGQLYKVGEIRIDNGFISLGYKVEVSVNGYHWETIQNYIYSRGDQYLFKPRANTETLKVNRRIKYLKITILETNAPRSRILQAFINEVEIYPIRKREREQKQIIIPGTWNIDLDSMRLTGSLGDYKEWLTHFGVELTFDLDRLRFQATGPADLWWEQVDDDTRYLVPENGAEIAYFGEVNFEQIGYWDLVRADYRDRKIDGSDCHNRLKAGVVLGIRTSAGNYVKFRIIGYEPLLYRSGKDNITNYNLEAQVVLYPS